jgi:hypothetical protein
MRIYRFNPETGLYLGEDFADKASFKGGAFEIPEDATTIPPPKVKRGEVPVFDADHGKWEVQQLNRETRVMERMRPPSIECL